MKWIFPMQTSMKVHNKLILIFDEDDQTSPEFPKYQACDVIQYIQQRVRDEIPFLHADKHQRFLQNYFNTLGVKVSYKLILLLLIGMIKHSQSTQIDKFAISLQYFKKGKEFIFYIQMNIKVSTSWHYFGGSGQTCPNPKIGIW